MTLPTDKFKEMQSCSTLGLDSSNHYLVRVTQLPSIGVPVDSSRRDNSA